jgi:orotate phosphoribosyltransferase
MSATNEYVKIFEAAGAIRHGHFELSSGLHSATYVQCALVLQYPRFAEKLGRALAGLFSDALIEAGTMTMRRGFSLRPDQHVLVVEDVWTTGGSTQEAIRVVQEAGGRVVAVGALIDRSGGAIDFPVESQALLNLPIASYEPDECPLCREGSAAVKPGSRFVRSAP